RNYAELQAFSYAAAHDLKEPLRTVSAYTELLMRQAPLDETCEQFATLIVDSAHHMASLLDDLLSLASLSFQEPGKPVELQAVVDQAISNLLPRISENSAAITVDSLPLVEGHENHLVQVFQNLIGNAIKYRGERPPEIRISDERIGSEWVVRVTDNGIGIDPK